MNSASPTTASPAGAISTAPLSAIADQGSRWDASLNLRVSGSDHGSVLIANDHQGPLYVQKPFYPEGKDCPHIYLLHPPGGIVSGDSLKIDVSVEHQGSLLITTPGANRFYRARKDNEGYAPLKQSVYTKLRLQPGCNLEWFPMETIVFSGASTEVMTEVHLDDGALFCGWEVVCLGLPASAETFTEGDVTQVFSLYCNKRPLFIDRLSCAAGSPLLSSRPGMGGNPVSGVFVVGPFSEASMPSVDCDQLINRLREKIEEHNNRNQVTVTMINGLVVIRYLGQFADEARKIFATMWQLLRPLIMQKEAVIPRIWAT